MAKRAMKRTQGMLLERKKIIVRKSFISREMCCGNLWKMLPFHTNLVVSMCRYRAARNWQRLFVRFPIYYFPDSEKAKMLPIPFVWVYDTWSVFFDFRLTTVPVWNNHEFHVVAKYIIVTFRRVHLKGKGGSSWGEKKTLECIVSVTWHRVKGEIQLLFGLLSALTKYWEIDWLRTSLDKPRRYVYHSPFSWPLSLFSFLADYRRPKLQKIRVGC